MEPVRNVRSTVTVVSCVSFVVLQISYRPLDGEQPQTWPEGRGWGRNAAGGPTREEEREKGGRADLELRPQRLGDGWREEGRRLVRVMGDEDGERAELCYLCRGRAKEPKWVEST